MSSGPSTGADGGEHVGTAVRGRRRPSGTPEHGFVAHVDGVAPERSRQTGARGDSPTCGHRPYTGHHSTSRTSRAHQRAQDGPQRVPRPTQAGHAEESECESHHHVDERETTRPTGESPGPQERAHVLRTGLNVSHGWVRRAASHDERPGAHNQGHTTRQDTPHDQDTCRVCSPAGRRNVSVERAVCVRRTPAQGGWGAGMCRGGVPIYSRPDQEKLSGGTGVAGGSVGTHEVPAAGSSPLILRVGESACGVARVVRSWGSELGHGRLPPYPP